MTDREKLKALLDEWGVPYLEDQFSEQPSVTVGRSLRGLPESGKVTGYRRFFTDFEFDDVGSFVRMGAWE